MPLWSKLVPRRSSKQPSAVRIRWSPAQELLELASGIDPAPPEAPLDLDYLEHLVKSYERMREMAAFQDLMRRVAAEERRLSDKWKSGQVVTKQEQGAARAFNFMRRAPDFASNRYKSVLASYAHKKKRRTANERRNS